MIADRYCAAYLKLLNAADLLDQPVVLFDLPAFVMEVCDPLAVARQIATDQIQPASAYAFVRKGPANQQGFVIEARQS